MVTGKSGDSGDEMPNDEATTDSDSNDIFAFLAILGGTDTSETARPITPSTEASESITYVGDSDNETSVSTYSYVSKNILNMFNSPFFDFR